MLRSILLTGTTLLLLWFVHGNVLWSPHELDVTADGVKNLFAFAWHSELSHDWFNMNGMAAPFGEHFFYTDGHPFLSLLWRPLVRTMGWYGWSGPLISWLITLSWVITPLVLSRLLKHYGATSFISFTGAIAITLLAPQIPRAEGHYSLSYVIFIPLLWWWLVQYTKEGWKLHWFLLLALNVASIGTHVYLGIITTAFALLYLLITALQAEKRKRSLLGLLTAVIPLLLFVSVLKLTDHHACRIDDPGGFFEMRSSIAGVLLPEFGPFHWFSSRLDYTTHWEGRAYIGLAALTLLILGLLIPFFRGWYYTSVRSRSLLAPAFAAILLFMIACGQPFLLVGKDLLNEVPYLQQFRGIGRLAWPVYFVLTVMAVLHLDIIYRNLPKHAALVVFSILFGLWGYEAYYYHADLAKAREGHPHPISRVPPARISEAAKAIQQSGADLIIPLPYFHIGSEFYGRAELPEAVWLTLSAAYHSQVPTSAALLTRTSLTETRNLLRLLALPRHERNMTCFFNNADTIALLKTHDQLRRDEAYWWELATPLVEGSLGVRLIPASYLFGAKAPDDCDDPVIMQEFQAPYSFDARHYHTVWSSGTPDDWLRQEMELTLEFKAIEDGCLKGRGHLKPQVVLQRRDGDRISWLDLTYPEAASEHTEDGSWARASLSFKLDSLPELLECVVFAEQAPYDVTVKNLILMEANCP